MSHQHRSPVHITGIALLQVVFCVFVLAGCGGGGSADAVRSPVTTISIAPVTTTVPVIGTTTVPVIGTTTSTVIANLELAQSMLFNSSDSALVLVAGKDVLVKVNVTSNRPADAKPAGSLLVESSTGVQQTITLTPPTGALPAALPDVPSFADSYTAVLPGNLVKTGLRLTASLSNGQNASSIAPRVGGGVAIKIVVVPVQVAGAVGSAPNVSSYVQARTPAASVTQQTHVTYVSTKVTVLPTDETQWISAMPKLLGEINALYVLEGAPNTSYYYGAIPKTTYGVVGQGYVPGHAVVVFNDASNPTVVSEVFLHELGHNLSLNHAPCGNPDSPDLAYPYANALLGAASRFIWGYNAPGKTFTDPRDTKRHDVMSYCSGDTFSDYNYRKIQVQLTPADALVRTAAGAFVATGPQDLMLVSGELSAGKMLLNPLKSFSGEPKLLPDGPYTLRIVKATGGTQDYRFGIQQIDHDAAMQHFAFSIPHPGNIASISILKDGITMMQTATKASSKMAPDAGKTQGAASVKPQVQVTEEGGKLRLTWDHLTYPYLTVTHVGAQRVNLTQDLTGGRATLSTGELPAGGSYEFSLSDGLNSIHLTQGR